MNQQKLEISKSELIKLYVNRNLSTHKISKIYKCNPETIRRRLIEHKIKRRKERFKISKRDLENFYINRRMSILEISKKFGISSEGLREKLIKFDIRLRSPNEYHKWKEVGNLVKPILKQSKEISYILGVILGDGWVYKRGYTYMIGLEVKEKRFCEKFFKNLKIIKLNPKIFMSRGYWRTIAISKLFYKWFKGLKFEDIKTIAKKYPLEFLRGFYESEGSLSIVKSHEGRYIYPLIVIVNTKKSLILLTKNLLVNLNFNPTIIFRKPKRPRKPIWALRLGKTKDVIRFLKLTKPSIKYLNRYMDN